MITLEGGEGGGKSTQMPLLQQRFEAAGIPVLVLREPGGTVISEQIREVVLSAKNTGIANTAEVMLFQAARAQIYHELVLPALAAGKIVLMDRSRDSSVVYQGMVRGFGKDLIEKLNNFSTQETYPDLTLLLDVSVQIGLGRRGKTDKMDRLDSAGTPFHEQVRKAYLELAADNASGRWMVIDGSGSVTQVQELLWQAIVSRLPKTLKPTA